MPQDDPKIAAEIARMAERAAKEMAADVDAVSNKRWTASLAHWRTESDLLDEAEITIEAVPRFAESRSTSRAVKRFIAAEQNEGRCVALIGSGRDIRFLRTRLQAVFSGDASWKSWMSEKSQRLSRR